MVRRKLIWSEPAETQLNEILYFFYKRNGNNLYGKKLRAAFRQSTKMIARFNEIGIRQKLDKRHIRYVIVEKTYQLFYEITENQIIIFKIWDIRRNPNDLKL
jgi:plasmid stabilization system protein ParE